MVAGGAPRFRRDRIRHAFDRVASTFTGQDFLYREMSRRMVERLDMVRLQPEWILDVGCGLGADRLVLTQRFPAARWVGLDHSIAMLCAGAQVERAAAGFFQRLLKPLHRTPALRLAADMSALPFQSQQMDLLWSNAALHWLDDLPATFKEFNRVIRVGGLLMFSLFGPDTLKELRQAIRIAGGEADLRIHRFVDMHDIGDMLVHGGFADPVMDMETLSLTYADPWQALKELKAAGSCVGLMDRFSGLTPRGFWSRVIEHWPRDSAGRYTLTFELVQGHAWKAVPRQHEDGRAVVNFMPRPKRP
jgi:malonyl-CoA O-methyltransferase